MLLIYTDRIHISSIREVRMKEAKEFVSTFITPALSLLLCGRRVSFFLLLPYMNLENGEKGKRQDKALVTLGFSIMSLLCNM